MTSRESVSTALLVAGYPLATWAALRFVPMWRQRRIRRFLAFEAGTAAVVVGLALRRRNLEAAANAAILGGLALAWVLTNRPR
jgi:hypothetical protein